MNYNENIIKIQEHLMRIDPNSSINELLVSLIEKIIILERNEFLSNCTYYNK